ATRVVEGGGDGGNGDLRARTALGAEAARKGRYDEAWQHLQLRAVNGYATSEQGCAPYSSGQVRQSFAGTPCRRLDRALLVVGTGGDAIGISVIGGQMPSTNPATQLKQMLDKDGTGDISPLPGQELALDDIRFTGKHYSSRRSGALVVTAEAEPVRGQPATDLLDAVTQVAVELPPRVIGRPPATPRTQAS